MRNKLQTVLIPFLEFLLSNYIVRLTLSNTDFVIIRTNALRITKLILNTKFAEIATGLRLCYVSFYVKNDGV